MEEKNKKVEIKEIDDVFVLENRISDLVSSASFFNYQTIKIGELFEKPSKPQEQSFALWRKIKAEKISAELEDFQKITELYEKSNLKNFRDKITNHRDNKNANDVLANFLNPVKEEHIIYASKIIDKLKEYIRKYFNEPEYNFNAFYDREMKEFMLFLEDKYK